MDYVDFGSSWLTQINLFTQAISQPTLRLLEVLYHCSFAGVQSS